MYTSITRRVEEVEFWHVDGGQAPALVRNTFTFGRKEQGNSTHVLTSNRQISQGAKWLINAILVMPKGLVEEEEDDVVSSFHERQTKKWKPANDNELFVIQMIFFRQNVL